VKALCLGAFVAIAVTLVPNSASSYDSDQRLTVMSMNVHGLPWPITRDPKARMAAIAGEIERRKPTPDLVFLQEVWSSSMLDGITSHLNSPYKPLFASGGVGPKGGLVILLREADGWTVSHDPDFQAYRSSAPAWKFWQGDGLAGKGLFTVELDGPDRQIVVVDTHLQSQYPGDDYKDIRLDQLAALRETVGRLNSLPVLIAGDFNTDSKESDAYAAITAIGVDLTKRYRDEHKRGTIFDPPTQWIDYILAAYKGEWQPDPRIELIENSEADIPFSDHQGLFATLVLPSLKTSH
jgi:endonuclease/exonuclease/phosphatase family metal-dependent hydrolase